MLSVLCEQFQEQGLASLEDVLPRPAIPSHGGNAAVEPERWGMRKAQMRQFIEACMLTREWEELAAQGNQYKKAGHVNGYELCSSYVVPWTKGTGCSVSLLMNETPMQAEVMISHAWGEDMEQVCQILQDDVSDATVVWFCILANYQPQDGCGPSISEQLARDPFGRVIRQASQMLVLHTTTAAVYTRLWCCFEMGEAALQLATVDRKFAVMHDHSSLVLETVKAKRNARNQLLAGAVFVIAALMLVLLEMYMKCYAGTGTCGDLPIIVWLVYGFCFAVPCILGACLRYAYYDRELQVDTANASCSNEDDTAMITEKLKGSGGFAALDNRILALRIVAAGSRNRCACMSERHCAKFGCTACMLVFGLCIAITVLDRFFLYASEDCLLVPGHECNTTDTAP